MDVIQNVTLPWQTQQVGVFAWPTDIYGWALWVGCILAIVIAIVLLVIAFRSDRIRAKWPNFRFRPLINALIILLVASLTCAIQGAKGPTSHRPTANQFWTDQTAIVMKGTDSRSFQYVDFKHITQATGIPIAPDSACTTEIWKADTGIDLSDDGSCVGGRHSGWPIEVSDDSHNVGRDISWIGADNQLHTGGTITVDARGRIGLYDAAGKPMHRQDPKQVLRTAHQPGSLQDSIISGFIQSPRYRHFEDQYLPTPASWNSGMVNALVTQGTIQRHDHDGIARVWLFDVGGYLWLSDASVPPDNVTVTMNP